MGEAAVLLHWVDAGALLAVPCLLCFLWGLLLQTVQAWEDLSFGSLSWLALLPSAKDIIVLDCLGGITPHMSPETRVMRCPSSLSHPRPGFFLWQFFPKSPLNKQLSQEPLAQAPPLGKDIVATFINSVTSLPPRTLSPSQNPGPNYKPQNFP